MIKTVIVGVLSLTLMACNSLGRGIIEGYLDRQQQKDTRRCQIKGIPFAGIEPYLVNTSNNEARVLMIHGVGDHLPGYSAEFIEKLAKQLKLTVVAEKYKEISLTDPAMTGQGLGKLRIHRLLNEQHNKELLFYEFTWSEVTAPKKEILRFDNSGEYSYQRTQLNNIIKQFSNDVVADSFIYQGKYREHILKGFTQSFCWMLADDWQDLPDNVSTPCPLALRKGGGAKILEESYFAFVSHSLGSRLTIDGLQRIANVINHEIPADNPDIPVKLIHALKKKQIPIYMLSNQLPLLQLGLEKPLVTEKKQAYCQSDGEFYADRMLAQTHLIAISDPNDLLSYAIPQGFTEKYLDSRLCIDVTNVTINIVQPVDLLGLGEIVNPAAAHIGYGSDDRVVGLISQGIGTENTTDIVEQRCEWTKVIQ